MQLKYELYVDDNYYYLDEDERYRAGEFDTLEEAITEAKRIIDEFLLSAYKKHPGLSAEGLFKEYTKYGVDPWILPNYSDYNSWEYAEMRSKELCTFKEPLLNPRSHRNEDLNVADVLSHDVDSKIIS
jgi:hypothetical protein